MRCSYGAVYDVVVDLRPDSPTYRNWESFDLNGDRQASLYIPSGCAHGFQALTDVADVSYRIDRAHDPSEDIAICFDSPELGTRGPSRRAFCLDGINVPCLWRTPYEHWATVRGRIRVQITFRRHVS